MHPVLAVGRVAVAGVRPAAVGQPRRPGVVARPEERVHVGTAVGLAEAARSRRWLADARAARGAGELVAHGVAVLVERGQLPLVQTGLLLALSDGGQRKSVVLSCGSFCVGFERVGFFDWHFEYWDLFR